MKVELGISAASSVISMSGCGRAWDTDCGIRARAGLI